MQGNVQVPLALQDCAISNDVVSAVGQSEEHHHHKRKKQIGRYMKGGGKIVAGILSVAQDKTDQRSQDGRLKNCRPEIGAVAQFADEGAPENRRETDPFVSPALWSLLVAGEREYGRWFLLERDLPHFLDQAKRFILVTPVVRGVASGWYELPPAILFVNDVAT